MATPDVLSSNERGHARLEGNAFLVDSTIPDASELGVGAPAIKGHSGGGGKFRYDVLLPEKDQHGNHKRREIAHTSAGEGQFGAEWKLVLLKKDGQTIDADQITVMQATAQGIEFLVPVIFSNGGGPTSPAVPVPVPHELWSHDRQYYVVEQVSDGNLVVYRVGPDGSLTARWDRASDAGKP